MISPFSAAVQKKSASELFPDPVGTKLKPEGEKNDRFSRLLHRCEQGPTASSAETGPKDTPFPLPRAVFPAMLRGVTGADGGDDISTEIEGAEATSESIIARSADDISAEIEGTEAVLSLQETDLPFSGEIPEEETLSPEEELSLSGDLPQEGALGGESAAAGGVMVVRDDRLLHEKQGEPPAQEAVPRPGEEKGRSPLPADSSAELSPKESPFRQRGEAAGTGEEDGASPEKQLSGVLPGGKRASETVPRNDNAEQEETAGALATDRTQERQERNGGAEDRGNRPSASASGKESVLPGTSKNGDGEKGEGRQSFSGKNDDPGAALFVQRPAQGPAGVRVAASPFPGGFARELALAGRGGAALEDGMHNVVRFMRAEGHHRASMIVDPPALGRVEIELAATTGGVEASIRVGNEQLRQLVQDQIALLRTHLQQQGVQVAEFTVDIRDSGGDGSRGAHDRTKGRNVRAAAGTGETEEDAPSFAVDLEQGLLHWVA
ncbi:flagellar hook-length control protein FliK [Aminivibrio sp.]|uniref:flagellar hook-length control protein FliK n=1 Tax=Aminivibrio sp. TaxID=1872489 RepID=UPI001A5D65B1|nr:flagellar hook-length control protein FliK [Aminivibrio sp.]MBL3538768.1 flagellar hook-length control protein FliK [Aminivibrio sp.]